MWSKRLEKDCQEIVRHQTIGTNYLNELEAYKLLVTNLEKGFDIRNNMNKFYFIILTGFGTAAGLFSSLVPKSILLILLGGIFWSILAAFWRWQIGKYYQAEHARLCAILQLEERLLIDGYNYEERFFEAIENNEQDTDYIPSPYNAIWAADKNICNLFIIVGVVTSLIAGWVLCCPS